MKAIGILALLPVFVVVDAWVLQCVWNWAVSPSFGVSHVTLLQAAVGCLVLVVVRPSSKSDAELGEALLGYVAKAAILLAAAAVIGALAR